MRAYEWGVDGLSRCWPFSNLEDVLILILVFLDTTYATNSLTQGSESAWKAAETYMHTLYISSSLWAYTPYYITMNIIIFRTIQLFEGNEWQDQFSIQSYHIPIKKRLVIKIKM